jgi:hypothetical protein
MRRGGGPGDLFGDHANVFHGSGYSIVPPAGWDRTKNADVQSGGFLPTQWHLDGSRDVYLRVDQTPGYAGSPKTAAAHGVRRDTESPVYSQNKYGPVKLPAGKAWRWEFTLGGEEKVDVFLTACKTGYAVLATLQK